MLSKLSHMQTRNDVQSYIAERIVVEVSSGHVILHCIALLLLVAVVVFIHFTNFLQSCCCCRFCCCNMFMLVAFLYRFLFTYVCFSFFPQTTITCVLRVLCTFWFVTIAHSQSSLSRKNYIHTMVIHVHIAAIAAFRCIRSNLELLSSYLYLQSNGNDDSLCHINKISNAEEKREDKREKPYVDVKQIWREKSGFVSAPLSNLVLNQITWNSSIASSRRAHFCSIYCFSLARNILCDWNNKTKNK